MYSVLDIMENKGSEVQTKLVAEVTDPAMVDWTEESSSSTEPISISTFLGSSKHTAIIPGTSKNDGSSTRWPRQGYK